MSAFQELLTFQRDTEALVQVAGRLGWDQETMMPRGAAGQRAEEMGAMQAVIHARRTDPRIGDWLSRVGTQDQAGEAMLRHIRRDYERLQRVPEALAVAIAKLTSRAQGQWAEARQNDDFAAFAPVLEEVLRLKREEGAALADGGDIYDALLEDYEPETSAAQIEAVFDAMRPGLVALSEQALSQPARSGLSGTFDEQGQMKLSRMLAKVFGYDMGRGRVDKAVHPFSSGSGDDVRITTRPAPDDPFNCIYSTIHETGHGAYEQNINSDYRLTPLGRGVSMGVHESQSRIYENQLGRSEAFCGWLYGQMCEAFGDLGLDGPAAFYCAVNRLHRGFIRTEADEVQYNLHIMLRFDLERALVSGDLQVVDLEGAWNERFEKDFGIVVDRASNGVLQDVHWSVGLFGYFPTYALGNVYAGCLHEALRQAVPDLDDRLAVGQLAPATDWLRDNLQVHGGLFGPREVITRACGRAPDEVPLMRYLDTKFGALYG
jgi:carboxypeptidase Taq